MNITVGVISYNPGELLERCLKSLIDVHAGVKFDLKLQLTPGSNAENWNRLVDRCNSDFICILEDDTAALKPMWLKSMVQTMKYYPKCGIVMPIETKDGINEDPGFTGFLNKTSEVIQTYGFCNLIRKEPKIRADEKLTYFVDIDLAYQSKSMGYSNFCNGHVWMLHGSNNGRMSTVENIEEKQAGDRIYLSKKWNLIEGEKGE